MIHKSASSGYQKNSDKYSDARPSYHSKLLERFQKYVPKGRIVELGAGTGIFTRQLLEAGYKPIAIEPVREMRAKLAQNLPEIDVRAGTAEQTNLESNTVDAVVAAQAFHWFNYPAALSEIKRILVPGGMLVCVWNVRDVTVDWVKNYEDIINQYEGNTPRHRTMDWRKAIDLDPDFELIDEWSIPNPKISSPDAVVSRALSTSFIGALDPDTQQSVVTEIKTLVSDVGESFDFPYVSEIQVWKTFEVTSDD